MVHARRVRHVVTRVPHASTSIFYPPLAICTLPAGISS